MDVRSNLLPKVYDLLDQPEGKAIPIRFPTLMINSFGVDPLECMFQSINPKRTHQKKSVSVAKAGSAQPAARSSLTSGCSIKSAAKGIRSFGSAREKSHSYPVPDLNDKQFWGRPAGMHLVQIHNGADRDRTG